MRISFILLLSLCLFSCSKSEKTQEVTEADTTVSKNLITIPKDTTIIYSLEGLSAEGTEATVKYVGGKIKEGKVNIFGETGQAEIVYDFSDTQIKVQEKDFTYNGSLESVKSDKDIKPKKELNYIIDFNGKPIGSYDKERIDIFEDFKKAVPFTLK